MAITKTYKDIITEPREKGEIGERRFSVIERRNSVASSLRSSGLRRRNGSVGVPRGVQEQMDNVFEGSNTSSMIGWSSYKTVKVNLPSIILSVNIFHRMLWDRGSAMLCTGGVLSSLARSLLRFVSLFIRRMFYRWEGHLKS